MTVGLKLSFNYIEMMKKIKVLSLGIFITIFCSCYQEDFLKDELLSNNSVDFLYSSSDGIANAVVGLYSLNREPYQRDWFNGAIPLILQAKSDISAGVDGEISLFSNCFWGCGLGGDYGTEAATDIFGAIITKLLTWLTLLSEVETL